MRKFNVSPEESKNLVETVDLQSKIETLVIKPVELKLPDIELPVFNIPSLISSLSFSLYTKKKDNENENNKLLKLNAIPADIWLLVCSFIHLKSVKPAIALILSCKTFYNKFYGDEKIAEALFHAPFFDVFNRSLASLHLSSASRQILAAIPTGNFDIVHAHEQEEEVYQPGENGFIMRR